MSCAQRRLPGEAEVVAALMPLGQRGAYIAGNSSQAAGDLWTCRRVDGVEERLGAVSLIIAGAALDLGWLRFTDGQYALTRAGVGALRRAGCERSAGRSNHGQPSRCAGDHDVAPVPPPNLALRNDAESPLTWLRSRTERDGQPMLSDEQFAAGERLRADLWYARMTPRVTSSWNGIAIARRQRRGAPGAWIDPSDAIVAARERVVRALVNVGPEHVDILIDVLGHLKGLEEVERSAGLPSRSAKRFLQRALTALARHYGYLRCRDVEHEVRQRLRHWGSEDYRPSLGTYE